MFGKKDMTVEMDAVTRILSTVRKKMTVPQISTFLTSVGCREMSDFELHNLLDDMAKKNKVVGEIIPKEIKGVMTRAKFWHVPGIELIEDDKEQK